MQRRLPHVFLAFSLSVNLTAQQFGAEQIVSSTIDSPACVELADFQNDGLLDILSVGINQSELAWFVNQGGGQFGAPVYIQNPGGIYVACAADFDLDGDADIMAAGSNITLFTNDGVGGFTASTVLASSLPDIRSVEASDLDGDGDLDIVTASSGNWEIAWYENLGALSFGPRNVLVQYAYATSALPIDLDGDLDDDVLIASRNASLLAWEESLGAGTFQSGGVIGSGDALWACEAIDLDQDGDLDAISVGSQTAWHENLGAGQFVLEGHVGIDGKWCESGDFDLDGATDLLIAGSEKVWLRNAGSMNLMPMDPLASSHGGGWTWVDCGDLDNDGDIDAVFCDGGSVTWHENLERDFDTDNDGILDADEIAATGTDPYNFDTDSDGVSDGTEIGLTQGTPYTDMNVFVPDSDPLTTTDPLDPDSDGGGVPDGVEDHDRNGAVDTWDTDPNDPGDEALAVYFSGIIPGGKVHIEVWNAAPLETIIPAYSLAGPGPSPTGLGINVDLTRPIVLMDPFLSDASGRASVDRLPVPASAPLGLPVWMQAVEVPISGNLQPRASNPVLIPIGAN